MHRYLVLFTVAAALLGGAAATSTRSLQAPPLPSSKAVPGAFVWHDLVTDNPAASRAFYGALFGWTFEQGEGIDPGYTIASHDGRQIAGIVPFRRREGEAAVAQWVSYVVVANVDQATETFRRSGGRVFRGPLNARKDLRVAVVADAQGAALGLANRGPLLEDEHPPALNRWLWMEYVARDTDAALKFYGDVIGYRHEVQKERNDFTYYLLTADRPRAGLFRSPWDRETSAWLPYVRVADPAAMAARAVELGGSVVLQPRPDVRNGSLAIVLDPTGAPVALQRFPFETGATP
ncbi:MAG TPA: VOC family protein [Vicinamibacterales bacterium]